MRDGLHPDWPRDDDRASARVRPVNRHAFFVHVRAVQSTARDIRAESREIVSRCVEDRIIRDGRRNQHRGDRWSRWSPSS